MIKTSHKPGISLQSKLWNSLSAAEILTSHNQQRRFCLGNTSTSQEFFRFEIDRETQAHSFKQYIASKMKGVS